MSSIGWLKRRCERHRNSEDWDNQPRPTEVAKGIIFAEGPPALQRARLKQEERCKAFFTDNKLRKAVYMKELLAGTPLHPDNEKEESILFWELWTPEEKEAQRERERLRNSCHTIRQTPIPAEQEEAELRRHSYLY